MQGLFQACSGRETATSKAIRELRIKQCIIRRFPRQIREEVFFRDLEFSHKRLRHSFIGEIYSWEGSVNFFGFIGYAESTCKGKRICNVKRKLAKTA